MGGVAPLTFLKFGILTKCVNKISRPNVVGKFGLFYHKKKEMQNSIKIHSHRNHTFTGDDGFYKEVIQDLY